MKYILIYNMCNNMKVVKKECVFNRSCNMYSGIIINNNK
jgi:hypothetical protein